MSSNGKFIINNERLISASSKYASASDDYAAVLNELKQALESLQWKDSMGGTFQALVPPAIANLEKIKENLENNSKMYKDIGRTASAYVAELNSNIKKMNLSA